MSRCAALEAAWAEFMTNEEIRAIALANGFSLREQPDGSMDLNPYVYEFARALRAEVMAERNPAKLGDYKIHTSLTERGNLRVKVETKDSRTEFFVSSNLTVSSNEASDKE